MSYREVIPADLLAKFDEQGFHRVKARLNAGLYSGLKNRFAPVYVAGREEEMESTANEEERARREREEDRSEAALSIASDALRIARSERIIAIIAAIAAIAAAAATIIPYIKGDPLSS